MLHGSACLHVPSSAVHLIRRASCVCVACSSSTLSGPCSVSFTNAQPPTVLDGYHTWAQSHHSQGGFIVTNGSATDLYTVTLVTKNSNAGGSHSASQAQATRAAYRALLDEDGVDFILAHASTAALAVEEARKNNTLVFATGALNPSLLAHEYEFLFAPTGIGMFTVVGGL